MKLKELPAQLRDSIIAKHKSGEGYKKKGPKFTVASIILKWKRFGTITTLPRAGHLAKLSSQGEGP